MAKKNKAKEKEAANVTQPEVENEAQGTEDQDQVEVSANDENGAAEGYENGEAEELDELSQLKMDLGKAQQEAAELRDKNLRLMAEFDNFRKRTRKEAATFREYASEEMMTALLPVIDDFGRTMAAMDKTDNLSSLKEGVTLVNGKLWNILEKKGLRKVEAMGADFDLEYHEAIHSLPVEEEDKKGKVLDVVETGYQLKDKVIRYAKVVVGE